jgi:hypothetical protein
MASNAAQASLLISAEAEAGTGAGIRIVVPAARYLAWKS